MTALNHTLSQQDREHGDKVFWQLAVLLGVIVTAYFALVPYFGLNIAFHFYMMMWITMATAFNISSGFSGYMPFGYVAFYGIGAFTTAILVKKLGWSVIAAVPMAGVAAVSYTHLTLPTNREV